MLRLGVAVFALIASISAARADDAERDAREQKCIDKGWTRIVDQSGRRLLWKGPGDRWAHGAIIVMHGGGGSADHWCHEGFEIVATQVAFANAAIAQGFAVFTLDSTDRVTDREGCAARFGTMRCVIVPISTCRFLRRSCVKRFRSCVRAAAATASF